MLFCANYIAIDLSKNTENKNWANSLSKLGKTTVVEIMPGE
jgi:hypothetical protein